MANDTGLDLGKAQIDAGLLTALKAEGVDENYAREIARMDAFGGAPVGPWISGLRTCAMIFDHQAVNLDWGMMPRPWDSLGTALTIDGHEPAKTVLLSLSSFGDALQIAMLSAISALAMRLAKVPDKAEAPIGDATPTIKMEPIDRRLAGVIQRYVALKGSKERNLKDAGEQMLDWLWEHGEFIRTILGVTYYLYRDQHRLFALDSVAWKTWLYLLTLCNPTSKAFGYLQNDCVTAAEQFGSRRNVLRMAHWDTETQMLRISRFDGMVYRLDGQSITEETNGAGPVLFDDAPYWWPYQPDFTDGGAALDWSTSGLPHWEGRNAEMSLMYLTWVLASFFPELCPTKPILTLKGEKGSGKSMLLRVLLRLMFGPAVDVVGVPEKADAFTSLVSNSHMVAFDNMDNLIKEVRDKIASISTGKIDQVRKLYTTNETQMIQYRCWLAVTTRTPDTLQRDDLVDRILLLPVSRIDDARRARESKFLAEVMQKRNAWWGGVLSALNSVVSVIRSSGIPDRGGLRMEDWAALGSVIADALGQGIVWDKGLKEVKIRQSQFLLEDDVVVSAIDTWLASPQYSQSTRSTRQLYCELKTALYGYVDRPDANWPRSVKSFGRHLAGMQRELQAHLAQSGVQMYWSNHAGANVYQFIK